ncbi:DLW-39 family protein [Nitriliruptor alkaliphilus]|uniref:DLW-39 family protein n=1 Tax=Nitriliruptor alkaliphilus TaxID=427918 RepID=UPI0006969CF3|nr:DLW-39 family protein [Nitriliruptor alkaliphilus]
MSGHDTERTGPEDRVDRAAETAETAIRDAQHTTEDRIADARDAATEKLRSTEQQVKAKVRETEAKVRDGLAEVERTIGGFQGLSEPTPAGSVDEAAQQASDLRRAIDRDLDALQAKLPPGEELADKARAYGGAAVGVLAVGAAAFLGLKQRSERKRIEREARAHAEAIARYLPQATAAPRDDERGGRGGLVLLTLIAAAIGAIVVRQRTTASEDEPDLWGPA